MGYKLSITVDKKYKVIRKIETGTASTRNRQHFDHVIAHRQYESGVQY